MSCSRRPWPRSKNPADQGVGWNPPNSGNTCPVKNVYPPGQDRAFPCCGGLEDTMTRITALFALVLSATFGCAALAQQNAMTFFVTSVGLGKGADLGGLAGADRHCQSLAEGAGSRGKTWR